MQNRDLELIEMGKRLAGGTQQGLAEELGVTPSAVSNWVAQGRVPSASRDRLVALVRRHGHEALTQEDRSAMVVDGEVKPPDHLSADAERCGFWAESAWCFNYIVDPDRPDDNALTDEVWRAWKNLRVTRPTMFRHYFRYQPFEGGTDAGAKPDEQADRFGFGYLKSWPPVDWSRARVAQTTVNYLGAHVHLEPGHHGSGGYFVRARQSVLRWAEDDTVFEFVGFKPECPVQRVHLVLSIPKRLRAPGLLAAFRMATDYPQYYDFAERIVANQGHLADIVEPWGRDLTSEIKRLPQRLLGSDGVAGLEGWEAGWSDEERVLVQDLTNKFSPSEDRDVFIVTDHDPPPLATLLMFWPLRQRSA